MEQSRMPGRGRDFSSPPSSDRLWVPSLSTPGAFIYLPLAVRIRKDGALSLFLLLGWLVSAQG
jgi:hypothetical protein